MAYMDAYGTPATGYGDVYGDPRYMNRGQYAMGQYQYPAAGYPSPYQEQYTSSVPPSSGYSQHSSRPLAPTSGHSQHSAQPLASPVGYYETQTDALMEGEYSDGPRKTQGRQGLAIKAAHGVCCGCCCFTLVVSLLISIVVGHIFTRRHHDWEQPLAINCPATEDFCMWNQGMNIPPSNLTRYLKWNGCGEHTGYLDDATINLCGPPCFDSKLVHAMDAFNTKSSWEYVSFLSKAGVAGQQQLTLTAWWLPADPSFAQASLDGMIPVIVLQHGSNANFDSRMVQTYAYLLRSIGFSVFMPNLRDHGSSQKSSHSSRVTWGYDYYLDLMGAWDYVVNDPDAIFGGPREPSSVGIAGMSMGGYIAATVAGLNHDIPGLWLDSSVFDANTGELAGLLRSYGDYIWLGWLTSYLRAPTWFFAGWWAGVDIGYKQPSNTLTCDVKPTSGIPTKVALIDNSKDIFVLPSETRQFNEQMGKHPDCYHVTESWEAESECSGTHCTMIFQFPEVYRLKACQFWSDAFGRSEAACKLETLPLFTPVIPNMSQPMNTGSLGSASSSDSGALSGSQLSGSGASGSFR